MASKGWTNTTKDMYRRDGVMVKALRRKATGNNISICFPSKNVLSVCHLNLEPAAQWHTQTEQVYSFARTLFSKCHKISAHAAGQCAHGKEKLEGTLPLSLMLGLRGCSIPIQSIRRD